MNFVLGDYMKNFYSVCNINLFRVQYKFGGECTGEFFMIEG